MKKKLGVLISGSGTNLQSIIDSIKRGVLKAEIAVVVSNVKDAYGLVRAKKREHSSFFLLTTNSTKREKITNKNYLKY